MIEFRLCRSRLRIVAFRLRAVPLHEDQLPADECMEQPLLNPAWPRDARLPPRRFCAAEDGGGFAVASRASLKLGLLLKELLFQLLDARLLLLEGLLLLLELLHH